MIKKLLLASVITPYLMPASISFAAPAPCRKGLKGIYVTWSKTGTGSGVGQFVSPSGVAAVLPSFTWEVTGKPLSVKIATDEPFSGGNSMKGFYGQADDANNINIRIQANDEKPRSPIPHNAVLTLRFDAITPASGWGFSVIDIDVDQVRISARDASGAVIPDATIARWFVQKFDANPPVDGVNIPSWDPTHAAVVGSSSSSTTYRRTVEGGLQDTEAAAAWFQPGVALSELSFEYESLQDMATPSFHVLLAACATNVIVPTPTPASSGDSDGDSIPDSTEGTDDPDTDEIPNYLDKDSDGDTIPDSVEGTTDTDGDGIPDYRDDDSDGDGIGDRIERDPDATTDPESGADDNNDGIDDGASGRTNDPVQDSDGDVIPDYKDSDSDNDGKSDGDEAFDLDGDGARDVDPSGEDDNENGIDDAFDNLQDRDEVNLSFIGLANDAPCTSLSLTAKKQAVIARMTALADRVPSFARRSSACGGGYPSSLVSAAAAKRKAFVAALQSSFADKVYQCPVDVCTTGKRLKEKAKLSALAKDLFGYAKRSKQGAQRACPSSARDKGDTRRPTEAYLAQLESEIAKLPRTVTECD